MFLLFSRIAGATQILESRSHEFMSAIQQLDEIGALDEEFREIPTANGTISFQVWTQEDGRRVWSTGYSYSEPKPLALYGIWALDQGIPIGIARLYMTDEPEQPPADRCFQVLIATDEQSMWGRQCPACRGYWRSESTGWLFSAICCYCGLRGEAHEFLSLAQRAYVQACCAMFSEIIQGRADGKYTVKARELVRSLAESIEGEEAGERPDFFVERERQTRFACEACGTRHDILGHYGYCSCCGTRNEPAAIQSEFARAKAALEAGGQPGTAVRDLVDAFDAACRNYMRQLVSHVPLTPARRSHWERPSFYDLDTSAARLRVDFDIDMLRSVNDLDHVRLMFHRRHVYVHNQGVADEKYIRESGDSSVEIHQIIRESRGNALRLLPSLSRMLRNLHDGFHSILPPQHEPIRYHAERQGR